MSPEDIVQMAIYSFDGYANVGSATIFVVDNDDCEYVARQGINPTQVLIYRKDGKAMDKKKEVIPHGLVQAAESILVDANLNNNEFFGDFESTRTLTDDGMYLVTTFKIIPKKEEEK